MERACTVCGTTYTAQRATSQYCSDSCKQKQKRQRLKPASETKKMAEQAALAMEVEVAPESWVPSRYESQLNDVSWRLYMTLLDVDRMLTRPEGYQLAEVLELTKKAKKRATECDALWEVENFDIEQKIFEPHAFMRRTGLKTSTKPPIG